MTETNTMTEEKNPIQVADRLFSALELLAERGPMGLMELSDALDLHKSTMHRVLNSLIHMKYVKQDEESLKYTLTYKIVRLSGQMLAHVDVIEAIRPYLKQIVNLTGETVHLVQRDSTEAVYLLKVESSSSHMRLVSRVGSRIPLYCSGVGKAMLAQMDDKACRRVWENSDVRKLTPHTITEFDSFMECIEQIRTCGYACDNEENELGVCCVAIAFYDYQGETRYGISITGPVNRMTDEKRKEYAKILLDLKQKIHKLEE